MFYVNHFQIRALVITLPSASDRKRVFAYFFIFQELLACKDINRENGTSFLEAAILCRKRNKTHVFPSCWLYLNWPASKQKSGLGVAKHVYLNELIQDKSTVLLR